MKRKYFLVILFFLLAMFLSGCGGGGVTPNGEVPPDTDQAVVQEVLPIHDLAEQKLNDIVEGPGIDAEGTLNILGEYLNEQTCVESTVVDGNLLQINYTSGLISFILLQDFNAEPTLGGDTISENKLSIPDNFQKSFTNTIGIKSELDNQSTQNTKDIDDVVHTGGRNVLIWVPFAAEFNSWSGTTNDGEEWSHDIVSEYVNRFKDSTLSFNITTLDNEEADVASLQNLTDYDGMVIFNSHGSKGKWLATGEVVPWYLNNNILYEYWLNLKYMAIYQNMKVKGEGGVLASEPVYAVSSNWFISNLSGNFSNTIILNISCQSAKTDALWNVFEGKGAGAYFGFTDTTSGGFGWTQGWDLIEKLREGDLTTGEAYEEKVDPYYPNTTWIMWGEENLKFPKDTLSSIEVSPETMNIGVGDSQSIDSITAYYNNGSITDISLNACTYISSNTGVATVDTGVITAVAPGSATITVGYSENDITKTDTVAVTVSADVNHAPVISSLTANPSGININQTTTITCTASDQDGDTLTYTWTKTGGTFEGSTSGSSVTWRAPSTEGNYTVECGVSDGEASDSKSVNISVDDVNHAPVITSTAVTSAIKDEPYSYDVNATDSDGDTLVYSLTTKPTGMSINSSTGLITWTPTATGSFGVTIKVSDGELFDTQSFTVTVEENGTFLGQVQLISPSNGATLPPGDITFSWNPVSNATKYQFILYNSQGQIALDAIDSGTSSIVSLDIEETITWKIRAGDNSGNWGVWSNTWSLTIKSTTSYSLRDIGPAGGYIFYDKGYYSNGWRYLEAAPASTEWTGKEWGSYRTLIGATGMDIGTGQSNTTTIVDWLDANTDDGHGDVTNKTDRAAYLCDELTEGGYSDWFLPSRAELNLMYTNLKVAGVGGFARAYYWSSSECENEAGMYAWGKEFGYGYVYGEYKYLDVWVRAVRAF